MRKIHWGILGAGHIARSFSQDLRLLPDAEIYAVGSRSLTTATKFAAELHVPHAYSTYDALVADPEVDVVYIATPHVFHKIHSLFCLEAGKPVLVEKPFTVTATEAREVVDFARERNLFCMEAMWMRFIPAMRKVVELVKGGAIGDIRMITASLGFYNEFDAKHRLFDPELGGGAMLDLGIYPLSLIFQLLGQPQTITSLATIGLSNVDEQAGVLIGYQAGQIALLSTNIRALNQNDALIIGTEGSIHIHNPIYRPTRYTLSKHSLPAGDSVKNNPIVARLRGNRFIRYIYRASGRLLRQQGEQAVNIPCEGNGYGYEATEVMRCLREGLSESGVMPLDETLKIMEAMDAIREQWLLHSKQKQF